MGILDFMKELFVGKPPPEPAVAAVLPNDEPAVVDFPIHPDFEAAIASDADPTRAWQVYADWLIDQGISWGEVIASGLQGNPNEKRQHDALRALLGDATEAKTKWSGGVIEHFDFQPFEHGSMKMEVVLERVLKHPAGHFVRKLTLGLPPDEDLGWHMEDLIKAMANAGPLPCLTVLDLSTRSEHMDQPSWRRVGDIRGVWKAAPRLKELRLHGAVGSDDGVPSMLAPIDAPQLECFVFESGGLDESVALEVGAASWPSLTQLELWLGEANYGCTTTVTSLAGILAGAGLPKLTSLALKNSQEEGELIEAVAKSAVLPRLKTLDFSMGVMGSDARVALVKNAARFTHLELLELGDNYFGTADQAAIKAVLPMAEFGTQKDEADPESRYPSVGE